MNSSFTSKFFADNRQRLRKVFSGKAPIVISANGLLQRGGDSTYAFSQEANFWYLTGINEPDILLVMDRDSEYLVLPTRSVHQKIFDGEVLSGSLTKRSGIRTIYDNQAGWAQLSARLKKVKHVATIAAPPAYVDQYGMYTNPARAALSERLRAENTGLELLDLGESIVNLRMIKQAPELSALRQAIDITAATMQTIFQAVKQGKYQYEFEVEAELSRGFRQRGAAGHAFEPIVAGGKRACTLHNMANDGPIVKNELLLIDTGAEVEHYAADITRTINLSRPSSRQQVVHTAVVEVQKFAFGLLRPGVLIRDYEQQVEDFMGEKLRQLGLIKTINSASVRKYYSHSPSHFLGLNVHDAGDYSRPLAAGMVLTVEPGIYIPKEGIGVRIEDDVLITDNGIEILSDKLPRELT